MTKKTVTKKVAKKPKLGSVAKKAPVTKKYKLEISVNDIEHKVATNDLLKALTAFVASPEFPFSIKTRVLIKFSKGKNEGQRFYHVPEARRVFSMISHKEGSLEVLAQKMTEELNA